MRQRAAGVLAASADMRLWGRLRDGNFIRALYLRDSLLHACCFAVSWMSVIEKHWPRLEYVALGDMGKLLAEADLNCGRFYIKGQGLTSVGASVTEYVVQRMYFRGTSSTTACKRPELMYCC